MSRTVVSLTKVLLLLAACAFAAASLSLAAASSADCTSVAAHFPYAQSATECLVPNMCYTRTLCCPTSTTTDLNLCLDVTTFTCNLTSVCAAHTGDSSWYPFTVDNGLSVTCCQDGYTTTPAPSVPNFDVSASSNPEDSSKIGPLPVRTCEEGNAQGCAATNMFPSMIRAFCKDAIPDSYSDQYLVQSATHMCCQYAAAPAGTSLYNPFVGQGKCGFDLLDFPRVGEFHCAMAGRAATICCNGRITGSLVSADSSDSRGQSPVVGNDYQYMGNTCLYVPDRGDVAVVVGRSVAFVLALVTVVVTMLLVF